MPPWYVTSFAWTASSFWAELFVGSCDVDSVSQCKEVRMAAHITTDTACLPAVTSCSCSHNHVKPAAHSQRLTQRSSSFVSSQHTCRLPRRRLGRDSTQVWTAYSDHAAPQTVSALWLVMASLFSMYLQIVARAAQQQRSQTQVPEIPEGYVRWTSRTSFALSISKTALLLCFYMA